MQGWKKRLNDQIAELEAQLVAAHKQRAAERMGRIRGQKVYCCLYIHLS